MVIIGYLPKKRGFMEKRTLRLLIGGIIVIAAVAIFFAFVKNRGTSRTGDWRDYDYPGSGTNWIGLR